MLDLNFGDAVDLYNIIGNYDKKIYIWGLGSVAAGVTRELETKGIKIDGYFTNVKEYNIDPRIKNYDVYYLDDLINSGEKFSVIMGHSHYELAKILKKYSNIENIWSLAMIVRPDISMSKEFIQNNIDSLNSTYLKLSDNKSKQNMQDYLNVQLTRNGNYIVDNFDKSCTYFNNDVVDLNKNESYIDVGAYDGSSINEFIEKTNNKYKSILALEVMKGMYLQLKKEYNDPRIKIVNTGISDHNGYDYFNFNDQSTCLSNTNQGEKVKVSTVDNMCDKYNIEPTIMKMCIGNTIIPILDGSEKTLSRLPQMIITAGIDSYALIDYVSKIENIVGNNKYDFYLRYTSAMAECLILIAKPKEKVKIK